MLALRDTRTIPTPLSPLASACSFPFLRREKNKSGSGGRVPLLPRPFPPPFFSSSLSTRHPSGGPCFVPFASGAKRPARSTEKPSLGLSSKAQSMSRCWFCALPAPDSGHGVVWPREGALAIWNNSESEPSGQGDSPPYDGAGACVGRVALRQNVR